MDESVSLSCLLLDTRRWKRGLREQTSRCFDPCAATCKSRWCNEDDVSQNTSARDLRSTSAWYSMGIQRDEGDAASLCADAFERFGQFGFGPAA